MINKTIVLFLGLSLSSCKDLPGTAALNNEIDSLQDRRAVLAEINRKGLELHEEQKRLGDIAVKFAKAGNRDSALFYWGQSEGIAYSINEIIKDYTPPK